MTKSNVETTGEIKIFQSLGFSAGVVSKGHWKKQEDIYNEIAGRLPETDIRIIRPKQTHSAEILQIEEIGNLSGPVADGLIADSEKVCLTVRTADCIPVLFAGKSAGIYGILHIGWRGLAGGIIESLFNRLKGLKIRPGDLVFYLGPSIGKCCFEIGDEVSALFDDVYIYKKNGRYFADLPGVSRNKIVRCGVKENDIWVSPECTFCERGRYYSYRRDGAAPLQMVSYIFKT